ncbi:MAG TPA: hypothetical protein VGE67_05335 [Haloferula sp.]
MTSPVFLTLALVLFYLGVTLTFLNKEESRQAPVEVRASIQKVSR